MLKKSTLSVSLFYVWLGFAGSVSFAQSAGVQLLENLSPAIDPVDNTLLATVSNTARGIVKPKSQAELASEISAPILEVNFKAGQRFNKDDELIVFDCARYKAEYNVTKESLASAKQLLKSNKELLTRNVIGKHEFTMSELEFNKVSAELKVMGLRLDKCSVKAPYHGRVVQDLVNVYETPAQGSGLIAVVDDSDFDLDIIIPSMWLRWVSNGDEFDFKIEETGKSYAAVVISTGAVVDPVSQTIKLTGSFKEHPADVLPGMSGSASFMGIGAKDNYAYGD